MARATISPTTLATIRDEIDATDPGVRAQAIEALAILGDTRGLLAALRSRHAYVRRTAVRGLADVHGVLVTWQLARLARDPDEGVRTAVARALTGRSSCVARWGLGRVVLRE